MFTAWFRDETSLSNMYSLDSVHTEHILYIYHTHIKIIFEIQLRNDFIGIKTFNELQKMVKKAIDYYNNGRYHFNKWIKNRVPYRILRDEKQIP